MVGRGSHLGEGTSWVGWRDGAVVAWVAPVILFVHGRDKPRCEVVWEGAGRVGFVVHVGEYGCEKFGEHL
eukprot:7054029-Prymnesium_polylepis.1